jgi:hypothetical protein
MKCIFLSFVLLVTSQLLGADFDEVLVPVRVVVEVTYIENVDTKSIQIKQGSTIHSYEFSRLCNADKQQIRNCIVALLEIDSLSEQLSYAQKSMINLLRIDNDKIDAIVNFLYETPMTYHWDAPYSPRWGESH